jgi:hypothetical protein
MKSSTASLIIETAITKTRGAIAVPEFSGEIIFIA